MGTPSFRLFSDDQLEQINSGSLEVLETTGIICSDANTVLLMEKSGCLVSGNLVKIPPTLVAEALAHAPKRISLSEMNADKRLVLEPKSVSYCATVGQEMVYDYEKRTVRRSETNDLIDSAKVADSLDHVDFILNLGKVAEFEGIRSLSKKPVIQKWHDLKSALAVIEIVQESTKEFLFDANIGFLVEQDPPMEFSRNSIEAIQTCAVNNIPIIFTPKIVQGITGPEYWEGCCVLGNAITLAALVIHQLYKKGSPYIMGFSCVSGGDRGAALSAFGPEIAISQVAAGQLGQLQKIPAFGFNTGTESFTCDQQMAAEITFLIQTAALSGINLVGCLANSEIGNIESMVLMDEVNEMMSHFMKGIEVNDETIPIDLIEEVGPGGNFLLAEHTMKYYKEATFYPRYQNRKHFTLWEKEDGKNMGQKLHDQVKKVKKC